MISRITIISIWLQRSLKKTILTRADLGLPDAYINGDFSFVDKDEDLLIFFLAVTAMVQQAMQYIDETPDIETKIGYNYSRIKRAQLIKKLRWLKETTGVKILRSLVKRRLIQGAHIANSS
ncbi:uncharacterized protein LOC107991152 [Cucumis melo]|uniref:Uncharacterized protein LOC107991152 n=1 Tax=Cucumis melo TaxID=3656 RepID=A0ABM3LC49_CUCME|nr:uncharacterized protein LOC107991152 [Cucumis melo]XP_050947609.1 uncharacterized protein LOC107991152 [Cucumis melo]